MLLSIYDVGDKHRAEIFNEFFFFDNPPKKDKLHNFLAQFKKYISNENKKIAEMSKFRVCWELRSEFKQQIPKPDQIDKDQSSTYITIQEIINEGLITQFEHIMNIYYKTAIESGLRYAMKNMVFDEDKFKFMLKEINESLKETIQTYTDDIESYFNGQTDFIDPDYCITPEDKSKIMNTDFSNIKTFAAFVHHVNENFEFDFDENKIQYIDDIRTKVVIHCKDFMNDARIETRKVVSEFNQAKFEEFMKNKASEVESDPQEDKNHSNKRQRI
jgi:hypothetical protein